MIRLQLVLQLWGGSGDDVCRMFNRITSVEIIRQQKVVDRRGYFCVAFLTLALFGPGNIALLAFPMVGFSLSVMWSIVFLLH